MASASTGSVYQTSYKCNCLCGLPAIVLTSHTRKNPGRRFLRCSQYKDSSQRCRFFRWLDEGGEQKSYSEIHVLPEAEVLTRKHHEGDALSEIDANKHDKIVGDIGDILHCVSLLNQDVCRLKKEVRTLKEADRRRQLDASIIKRTQMVMGFVICVIVATICYVIF